MGVSEEKKLDGYVFLDAADYEQAKREWDTICNLENKMNLGDPKVALNLYNQAVSKHSFKTPVGYAFLKRLRDTIISCGLVNEADLNMIPVVSRNDDATKKRSTSIRKGKQNATVVERKNVYSSKDNEKIFKMYEKEKKNRIVLSIAVVALVGIIIAMFVLTMGSRYSYITYFTDYENDIRENVINEYEEWEMELEEREKELDNKTK